jgi:hypothetical protein
MTQIKDRAGEPSCQPTVRGPGGFRNGGYFKWLTSCVACKPARVVAGRALAIAQQLLPCYLAGRICAQRRNSVRHPSFRWPPVRESPAPLSLDCHFYIQQVHEKMWSLGDSNP